jgi:signal transduction histidine kinase
MSAEQQSDQQSVPQRDPDSRGEDRLRRIIDLQQVFDATTDSILLLDRDWRILFLNRAGAATLAMGRDLVGLNHWEVFPKSLGTVFETTYRSVMEGRAPAQFTQQSPTLGLWLQVKVYPTLEGIAVFFHDVTEAHNLELERAEAARRLRQALDAALLGTWTWDRATDLLDLDERAAQLFACAPHQPITRTALRERIVLTEDLGLTEDALRKSLESGGLYAAEYRVDISGGPPIWVAASGIATFAAGSREIAGMVGTVQDITARKTQEASLRESEKLAATGRLAATIAHEINNPLEAITNLIYLCKTDPDLPISAQHLLETADGELARVAHIAQQTLGFYRDTTRPVDIDLNQVLSATVELFARKLQHQRIDCRLELEPNLHIFGLQGEIRQVFSNLLVNAIDASSPGGGILFRAHRHRCPLRDCDGVSVLICDRGSGIPKLMRDRLFSPFFTTKQSFGTGLGLWVTRGIVEKQGGVIQVRSRCVAPSGTVFRLFLPTRNPGSARPALPFRPAEI